MSVKLWRMESNNSHILKVSALKTQTIWTLARFYERERERERERRERERGKRVMG